MSYLTQQKYYTNDGNSPTAENWGSYQKVFLKDIVNNFILIYSGNHELVNNEPKYKILFHAKRSIQEINYDASGVLTSLQLNVGEDLRLILPPDFVNFIKVSWFKDGKVRQLTENIQINYATQWQQDTNQDIEFYGDDVIIVDPSEIDQSRLDGTLKTMYLNNENPDDSLNGMYGWWIDGRWYFERGAIFGLNTETANINPTYRIDKNAGVINFSSDMANQSCILEYISDGLYNNDDSKVYVNKLFEDYIYADIEYRIMKSKLGVQEYVIKRLQKQKSALLANARIRVSNLHPAQLLMNLRGINKWLK